MQKLTVDARAKPAVKPRNEEEGHLIYKKGDVLENRYVLHEVFGEGTFGKVVKVYDKSTGTFRALKIIRNLRKYYQAAAWETRALQKLAQWDPEDNHWIIHLRANFEYRGHVCLLFDLLGPSIFEFMRSNQYIPYPIHQTIHIAWQLSNAVLFLHDHKLTHTDLKPENIIFVRGNFRTRKEGSRTIKTLINSHIRLIDFGSATFAHEHHSPTVTTRHYRAPEIILELGWNQSCDVWSIGCILYELYTGVTLFQTHDNLEHLAIMERVLGDFPLRMAKRTKTSFFKPDGRLNWNVNSDEATYVREQCQPLRRSLTSKSPSHVLFFDLMQDMLTVEPGARITMAEVVADSLFQRLPEAKRKSTG